MTFGRQKSSVSSVLFSPGEQISSSENAASSLVIAAGGTSSSSAATTRDVAVGLANPQMSKAQRRMLDLINGLLSTGVEVDIDLPRIAVVGSQSAGKSSLIESISGITLPRASGTCTRCPTECRLSYSPAPWKCTVSLYISTDPSGNPLGQAKNVAFGKPIYDKAEVEDRIRRAQLAILNPGRQPSDFLTNDDPTLSQGNALSFSKNRVSLAISGPNVADLSFVDLPGLIASVREGGNVNDIKLVESLVTTFISKSNCIILLTVACETDFENQGAFSLAKQFDPDGQRTIGVLTKPDRIDPGDEQKWISFIRNEKEQLKNNWFCVKQPSSRELTENWTWEQARQKEDEFFSGTSPWNELEPMYARYLRTRNLLERLSHVLSDLIAQRLPVIRQEIGNAITRTRGELERLPKPPPRNPLNEVAKLIKDFDADMKRHMEGVPHRGGIIQQIRAPNEKFRKAIYATAPEFKPFDRPVGLATGTARIRDQSPLARVSTPSIEEVPESKTLGDFLHGREICGPSKAFAQIPAPTISWFSSSSTHKPDCDDTEQVPPMPVAYKGGKKKGKARSSVSSMADEWYADPPRPTPVPAEFSKGEFTFPKAPAHESTYTTSLTERIPEEPVSPRDIGRDDNLFSDYEREGSPDPSSAIYIDEVNRHMEESVSRELPGHFPYVVEREYIRGIQGKWEEPATVLCMLEQRIRLIVHEHLGTCLDEARKKIVWLMKIQADPFTLNRHYYFDYKEKYLTHYRRERQTVLARTGKAISNDTTVTREALSLLTRLGYEVTKEDLAKLLKQDMMEPVLSLMASVRAYFQVAYKRVVDNVPMAIDFELVRGGEVDVFELLWTKLELDSLDAHRMCEEYAQEPAYLVHKREQLEKKLERLGTNTDSVLIDVTSSNDAKTRGVVASFKHTTTPDVTNGIEIAVQKVIEKAGLQQRKGEILSLTIGTTHFINAVVQSDASKLSKVAVIRLAAPYTTECPPFIDFPGHLKRIICGHIAILKGGLQINGTVVNELDEEELVHEAQVIKEKRLKNIVIVGIYSPLDTTGRQEYLARDILLRELGKGINVVCSRDVAQIGLLERENASILNASILPFARHTISSFKSAMTRLGLTCPLYLTQNDGTLTSAREAMKLPIRTFSSGATNSMRGAGYLAGLGLGREVISGLGVGEGEGEEEGREREKGKSVIVVDVGGTTTDVGVVLPNGYPRLAGAFVKIAGVRTNFSMPDVYSIGLGGGSRVHDGESGMVTVGPDSVGNRLEQESLVFGGATTTATDIIVRANNLSNIGAPANVNNLSSFLVQNAQQAIHKLLSIAIDKMKTSPEDIDVLLVGGGSIICPNSIRGVRSIIIPPHHDVANAIGAAIANISGEIDTIVIPKSPQPSSEEIKQLVEEVKEKAVEKALRRGAKEDTVRVLRVEVVPLALVLVLSAVREEDEEGDEGDEVGGEEEGRGYEGSVPSLGRELVQEVEVDYESYRPKVVGDEWILSETDLLFVMEGCGVLGTGGGGSPYSTYLICLESLRRGKTIRVVDHKSLPPDGLLARGAFMGSPSVGIERLRDPRHLLEGAKELAKYCGNVESYRKSKNDAMVETIMRVITTEMGSSAALCPAPLAVADARDYGITRCLSLAWWIGRGICICRQKNMISRVAEKILECQNGKCLFVGKIIEVSREVKAGFTWGYVRIAPLLDDEKEDISEKGNSDTTKLWQYEPGTTLRIPFQNEDLCAYLEKEDGTKTVVASVPDLITILDSQTGSHLGTPEYAYGLRVTVIALAGHPLWKTEPGLKVGGPEAFGFDFPFIPIAEYREPKSVVDEFRG
ncbi:hypothetical protein NP233_g376 [Leucocoprinus birnbaumii]|uniref:Uncharacterized protein n=1 Tax=Leucocoprinus birnbaumii TaxID=56174 RepID=A0AAD5W211_9AGAR|nr:hypothetical protein NP233_g376 [Leucocoprinus birnbaumii]